MFASSRAIVGKVLDVVVDLRKDSPSFGKYYSIILDDQNMKQLYVPKGCAHGFLTLSERSVFAYKSHGTNTPNHRLTSDFSILETAIQYW